MILQQHRDSVTGVRSPNIIHVTPNFCRFSTLAQDFSSLNQH